MRTGILVFALAATLAACGGDAASAPGWGYSSDPSNQGAITGCEPAKGVCVDQFTGFAGPGEIQAYCSTLNGPMTVYLRGANCMSRNRLGWCSAPGPVAGSSLVLHYYPTNFTLEEARIACGSQAGIFTDG